MTKLRRLVRIDRRQEATTFDLLECGVWFDYHLNLTKPRIMTCVDSQTNLFANDEAHLFAFVYCVAARAVARCTTCTLTHYHTNLIFSNDPGLRNGSSYDKKTIIDRLRYILVI